MQRHGLLIAWACSVAAAAAAALPAGWQRHVEPAAGFAIGVPPGFVVMAAPPPTRWAPVPRAVFHVAAAAQADAVRSGADLPALQLRLFDAAVPLAAWLQAQPAHDGATYRVQPDGAIEVCPATLLAPGCSVYRARGPRVVQLLPQGAAGEAVAASFEWLDQR